MADFLAMGYAYREIALASPQRYRLMFGLASPQLFVAPTVVEPSPRFARSGRQTSPMNNPSPVRTAVGRAVRRSRTNTLIDSQVCPGVALLATPQRCGRATRQHIYFLLLSG
jgi:hypothetical protein